MYVNPNFKTKKALKEVVKAYLEAGPNDRVPPVFIFSPGPFPAKQNGTEFVEGPHYPAPHTWYAEVEVENGIVVKVR